MRRFMMKEGYGENIFGTDADANYVEECLRDGVPEDVVMFLYREWGPEALDMFDIPDDLQAVIPGMNSDGSPRRFLGTWDEYRRAVDEAAEMLFEAYNEDYKGEDPDDLMDYYDYTQEFAEDVCDRIKEMLKEREENK